MALFGFLRPDQKRIDLLERRVAELVSTDAARQVAFDDVCDRVKRHLQRAAAIEQRTKDRPEAGADPNITAVLRTKFPQVRKES